MVWVQAYEKRQDVDADRHETFPGWLATLARNRCIDRLRRQGRQVGPDRQDPQINLDAAAQPAQVEAMLAQKQLAAVLENFAAGLEGEWQLFFRLHFQQGLTYAQVDEQMRIGERRCKYLKKVLAAKASRHKPLLEVLGRGEVD